MNRFLSFPCPVFGRLDLGGRRTEYLLIGGLIVVIVGALALVIFAGGDDDVDKHEQKWQCQAEGCKHEFKPPPVKTPPVSGRPDALMDVQIVIMDCPKCGAREDCLPMDECVKCEKSYVSDPTREWAERLKAAPDARPMGRVKSRNVCPHCNSDQIQWRRKQRGKSGRK